MLSHPCDTVTLWITCAGESMASCSISASSPRDVCEHFWPAAQPLCPHPTEYPPAHKEEGSSVLFLSGISHLPLRRTPHLSLASPPSCSAPRQQGGGACGYCPGKQETSVLDSGLAAGSALGSSPPCSSTGPACHRLAPKSVPMGVLGPFAGDTAEPWPCSPCSAWPHCSLSARCPAPAWPRSSHLHATSFTGTQINFTGSSGGSHPALPLPLLRRLARARTTALLTKQGGRNLLSNNHVPSNVPP